MLTDSGLPALSRDLGIPGIVDVHTHFLPEPVMHRVWEYFDHAQHSYGLEWPIAYRWDDAGRVEHLRSMGVLGFTALVYAHRPAMAEWLNSWALDFAAGVPECVPTATFYPEDSAVQYVGEALGRGAQLFKVHLQVGGFDPRDRLLDDVWGQLSDAGIPVLIHCGSAPVPGCFTGPGPVGEVLDRFSRLPVVIAHLGAREFGHFLGLARTRPLTWLDTTMALTDFMQRPAPCPPTLLPQLRGLAADGRVLFGSDFPNIPYPYAHQVEVLHRHGLDLAEVLWHAPAQVLGVPTPGPPR